MGKDIASIVDILEKTYAGERRTSLNRMREKRNPFAVLIGCLVSVNIKDVVCEKILEELFSKANTFNELLAMDTLALESILYNARYRKVKAFRLQEVSREILQRFGGVVPSSKEELLSIKGIGPKTANVVLNFAFDKPVIPVDSNTIRIANRIGWTRSKKADEVEKILVSGLTNKQIRGANALFMLHGTKTCVPVSPFCSGCSINKFCEKCDVERSR